MYAWGGLPGHFLTFSRDSNVIFKSQLPVRALQLLRADQEVATVTLSDYFKSHVCYEVLDLCDNVVL